MASSARSCALRGLITANVVRREPVRRGAASMVAITAPQGNESSTSRRADGQPMAVTLPIRIASSMTAGVAHTRLVRRGGKRRRVTVLERSAHVGFGRRIQIRGRLTSRVGQGVPGAGIQVFSRSGADPEQPAGVVHTDGEGRFRYTTSGTMSRTLRLAYGGSQLVLPVQREVKLRVRLPARFM